MVQHKLGGFGGVRAGLMGIGTFVLIACSGGASGGAATDAGGSDASPDSAAVCPPQGFVCEGTKRMPCKVGGFGGDGGDEAPVDCADEGKTCDAQGGCVECTPGEQSCEDGEATWCRDDGTLATYECDPVQGMVCNPDGCRGECALPTVVDSYIGCDYYPTVTLNPVWSGFEFAVAISNAATESAHVTVTRGGKEVAVKDVAPGSLELVPLPWVPELKGGDQDACQAPPDPGATRLVRGGAYRVRSDEPVTVYQFSPLEYEIDPAPSECPVAADCEFAPPGAISDCLSYTNDASLLLPATALTGNYTAMGWPSDSAGAGFLTITATEDGTQVDVSGAGSVVAGAGIDARGNGSLNLDRGDVLQLVTTGFGGGDGGADPTGGRVRANKPVQVIGGQSCGRVPGASTGTCDHMEQALVPEDTLGKEYVATAPAYLDGTASAPYVLRIMAIEKNTEVRFSPGVHDTEKLSPSDGPLVVELSGKDLGDVHVLGDKPLIVAQYMVGYEALPGMSIAGDPSMSLVPPVEQFRKDYLFTAPTSFIANFVNVVAPTGVTVRLDGKAIGAASFESLGSSGYSVARVPLMGDNPVHTLEADEEVGLVVYGYGLFTSYMYPGGMDLERITVPPII